MITKRDFQLSLQFSLFSRKLERTFFQKTKQAKPQLRFAPKIIKIRSVALENEVIEVESLVPKLKRFANLSQCWLVCLRPRIRQNISIFGTSDSTSINSFSKAIERILMIFDAKWNWGFACFVFWSNILPSLHEKSGNWRESWKSRFVITYLSSIFTHLAT